MGSWRAPSSHKAAVRNRTSVRQSRWTPAIRSWVRPEPVSQINVAEPALLQDSATSAAWQFLDYARICTTDQQPAPDRRISRAGVLGVSTETFEQALTLLVPWRQSAVARPLDGCADTTVLTVSGGRGVTEGIHALMAEFYSANLAAEIRKGMTQKAKQGGWPHQAPPGLPQHPQTGRRAASGLY
jgi:hypothetical protein